MKVVLVNGSPKVSESSSGALLQIPEMGPGRGTKAPVDRALSGLAEKIIQQGMQKNSYVSPAMPRILYKMAAQMGWRQMIRKNGGKARGLGRQC